MRFAVYGGSFNPPHIAHVLAASHVLETEEVDRVLVVPVFAHAFAKELLPFADRLEMCRIAFQAEQRVLVSDIEASLPRPSYTLNTVEALQARYPESQLRLVMGADVVSETRHWHEFDRVKEVAPPLVLGREGVMESNAPRSVLPEISSSQIRAWLKEGGDEAEEKLPQFLPLAVREYITSRKLYA